jgi:phosphatidylglycerophosphate synthase
MGLSLIEVRRRGQDSPHLAADPTYGRVVMRRISPYLTWFIVNATGLSANAVTGIGVLTGLAGAACFLVPQFVSYLLGVLLLQAAYLFDTADGEVARVRATSSRRGTYLDLIGHILQNGTLLGVTSFLFVQQSGFQWWAIAIAFAGLAFGSPFGVLARMQVAGVAVDAAEFTHGRVGAGPWPRSGDVAARAAWGYRRISFLWNYPASMNLYCLAALADAARFLSDREQGPLVLPLFAGAFGASLAAKQIANALRLLRGSLWEAPSGTPPA